MPQACTLPTADRPLRVAEFDELFDGSVRSVVRSDLTRLRVQLEARPQVAAWCASLAVRETECCSFFTFAITASGGELWLDVTVPDVHVGVLDGLQERATGAAA